VLLAVAIYLLTQHVVRLSGSLAEGASFPIELTWAGLSAALPFFEHSVFIDDANLGHIVPSEARHCPVYPGRQLKRVSSSAKRRRRCQILHCSVSRRSWTMSGRSRARRTVRCEGCCGLFSLESKRRSWSLWLALGRTVDVISGSLTPLLDVKLAR